MIEPIKGVPVYTSENPMPFSEVLDRVANLTLTVQFSVHKRNGTPCYFPYCKEEHDEYRATYKREEIVKVLKE